MKPNRRNKTDFISLRVVLFRRFVKVWAVPGGTERDVLKTPHRFSKPGGEAARSRWRGARAWIINRRSLMKVVNDKRWHKISNEMNVRQPSAESFLS